MSRWQRIEQLFLAASELAPHERNAYLDREAAGDAELLAAVAGMLQHADASETRFHAAIEQTAAAASSGTLQAPARIGNYNVIRDLGRGGMGAVYLAERAGGDFEQQVAIKVVKRGMDTEQIIERFRHERRILASLDHPHIARLFDGGATPDGLPYLVMEYIDGRPLVDDCQVRKLPLRERLILFEQICAAVQHAHQKLIVHRDLKPANILVTPAGTPKLLDFGIAKLLLPDDNETTPAEALTRVGARLLTPDYASPEQILGQPVSVATDVYSLGLVLYELLTGQRAHRFETYTEAEFVRVICQTEVSPPSEAAGMDVRLRRQLAGDLDNIVGLALRKDPARRYVSVEQFAGDIRRYLDGRTVLARKETFFYRARKLVMRNRVPAAAAAIALASLLAGIVGTTVQARRADAQAARAERRFQQVRKLANTFVFDIYDGMEAIPGTAKLRASVVTTALEYLDSLAQDADADAALQVELAAAYRRIGDVQGNPARSGLGQTESGLVSYEKALSILTRLARRDPPDARVLTDLGNLERATGFMYLNSGNPRKAIEHQQRSIAAWERLHPRRGVDLTVDTPIAQAWGIMGQALLALGESDAAVERHSAAVSLLREWLPRQTLPTTLGTLSLFLYDLGEARRDTGDLLGAVGVYEESLRLRRQAMASDPRRAKARRRVFLLDQALASVYGHSFTLHLGDPAKAEPYAADALRIIEELSREDKGSDRSVRDLMFGNWLLGCILLPEEPRRALPYLEAALASASAQARSAGDVDVLHDETLANAQEALGRALLATESRKRGLELMASAVSLLERISAQAPQNLDYRRDLIRAANGLGDALPPTEAAAFYRKAFQMVTETFPATGPRNVREWHSRAQVYLRWPRWNLAAPPAERRRMAGIALEAWQKVAGFAPANRAVQASLAEAQRAAGASPP